MKSWGITIILATGFGMGLFSLQLLSVVSKNKEIQINRDSNKIQDYWKKTDIQLTDLKKYIENSRCHLSQKSFLACTNSVLLALRTTNLHLNYDGVVVQNNRKEQKLDNYNEKQNLTLFTNLYKEGLAHKFNFNKIWESVLNLSENSNHKYLIATGINGYLSVAVDPHTYISPTNFFKEVSSSNERSKYFLGLSFEKKNHKIYIKKVFKNSDAEIAGLENNDEVLAVNGRKVENMSTAEVSDLLKDKDQESFPFVIQRNKASFVKKLIRSYRVLSQVQAEIINNGSRIGYIQLSKFAYNICENVKSEILNMKPSQLKGLILDLRDNPGGLLTEAACLAGLFIGEDKKIFSIKYLDSSDTEVALTTSEQVYFGPMTILTNNSSASASELIAGALQEYKRATIIGERTFGKGSFQEIEKWHKFSDISYFETKGFYLLPSGETTQVKGVTPDVVLNNENTLMNEFEMYQFPLKYKADRKSELVHYKMHHKMNVQNSCISSLNINLSKDKFIASAQQVLGCEIALSAKVEDKNENINL